MPFLASSGWTTFRISACGTGEAPIFKVSAAFAVPKKQRAALSAAVIKKLRLFMGGPNVRRMESKIRCSAQV